MVATSFLTLELCFKFSKAEIALAVGQKRYFMELDQAGL